MSSIKKKVNISKEALIEALLEMGRIAVLAAIPVAISQLEKGSMDYRLIGITALIAVLRGIDKYGYEMDKAGKNSIKLPF